MLFYDNINDDGSSFNTSFRSGNGKAFVQAYATSGMVANTPYAVAFGGSSYNATALIGSIYAYVGVPERVTASGCMGWVQIRGAVNDVQGAATSFTGSVGHNVYWAGATGLGATTSANHGNPTLGAVGILLEGVSSSTTANIFLMGFWATPI